MEWISVKDELPPIGIKVIFLSKHLYEHPDNIFTGVFRGDGNMYFSQRLPLDYFNEPIEKITHWMSLPEPPKV